LADASYILELLAGVLYVIAAVPLLRLARRTREAPECILGITFLLMGVSYLFYETPYALDSEKLIVPFSLVGRLLWDASVVTTAAFTREVFHRDRLWSGAVLRGVIALLIAGFIISVLNGDLEGMAPLRNPGFWFEWVGQAVPFVWVALAALSEAVSARRRVRVGLSNPLVPNRYVFFGCFGLLQLATVVLLVPMYTDYETVGTSGFTETMDSLMGALEMLTVATVWLAFFPPGIYRRWIERAAARSATAR
jgi:hypothetical protein